ncbi:MAG: rhomboid family intramembrane serine protease [Tateyamaria sp.]|uniref:rhomboid family intramembrane serine protease n=1 Tax=Tateyamaria sp. TaxID=1929288 RepID=UPI00329FA7F7
MVNRILKSLQNPPPIPIQTADKRALITIVVVCCIIELVLQLSDHGFIEQRRLRAITYEYAGFWPGLLKDWVANYPLQPYAMFITYGFLHSGIVHLLLNMVTLWSLGQAVIFRVGTAGLLAIYATSILGGAFGFYLLTHDLRPMIGASGALFGLAGALLAWMYVDRYTQRLGLLPVAQAVLLLILLNLFLWWAMDGQLAWETHLGGFISGWMVAMLVDPRPAEPDKTPPSLPQK